MAVHRVYQPVNLPPISSSSASAPPSFPGLVSALRPIKRLTTQIDEESALLRRFAYKNKNQHKGCGWWRKLMEVDRVMSRVTIEVDGFLEGLAVANNKELKGKGKEVADREDARISPEAVAQGLLRLPRSLALLDKAISVILGCTSVLDQLVASKAFLAFAVVIVSLVARLHGLCAVLRDEASNVGRVLIKLVDSNSATFPSSATLLRHTPRQLRRLLTITSSLPPSSALSHSNQPTPSPILLSPRPRFEYTETPLALTKVEDDRGAVVSRASLSASRLATGTPLPSVPQSPAALLFELGSSTDISVQVEPGPGPVEVEVAPDRDLVLETPPIPSTSAAKLSEGKRMNLGEEQQAVKKKPITEEKKSKKKKRGGGILALFD